MKKTYSPAFKAQIVRDVLREDKTISQLATEHGLHPNHITRWRELALAALPGVFAHETAHTLAAKAAAHAEEMQALYAEIGKLTTQLNWLKKKLPS
jgi:transposase-like protein